MHQMEDQTISADIRRLDKIELIVKKRQQPTDAWKSRQLELIIE